MVLRLVGSSAVLFLLVGCSGPVGLYHDVEGGAIAQARQAPPGADQPYPNLASVPPAPASADGFSAVDNATVSAGVSPPAPGALAGLALPSGPPPAPAVPGISETVGTSPDIAPPAMPPPAAAQAKTPSAPVALAFQPGSALLDLETAAALRALVPAIGDETVLVGGFGDAKAQTGGQALALALARARRLADALTADGVPGTQIRLLAAAAGSGGFVQLLY